MLNISSKYFSSFNNKPPASWAALITKDLLLCYTRLNHSFTLRRETGVLMFRAIFIGKWFKFLRLHCELLSYSSSQDFREILASRSNSWKYLEELTNLVRMNSFLRNFQKFSLDFRETVTAVTVTFLNSTSLCLYLNRS